MLPKLEEVEQLQQVLVGENLVLKRQVRIQEALLSNVTNLVNSNHSNSEIVGQIRALTSAFKNNGKS